MSAVAAVDTAHALPRAGERARAVAANGGVEVRELTEHSAHVEAERLVGEIWQGEPPISRTVMRTLSAIGGYVAGAYDGDGSLVGIAVGFVAAPRGHDGPHGLHGPGDHHLHSHITGISTAARGRDVGWAMKLHQRAWALERGIDTISWTFDPLVRRNAFFNLTKIGAGASAYLADFYGEMTDGINQDQGSDRLWVTWELCSEKAVRAAEGENADADLLAVARHAGVVLSVAPDGGPHVHAGGDHARVLVCAVPEDVEALRAGDAGLARAWRVALRRAMTAALESGMRIEGCTRTGRYVLVDERGDMP